MTPQEKQIKVDQENLTQLQHIANIIEQAGKSTEQFDEEWLALECHQPEKSGPWWNACRRQMKLLDRQLNLIRTKREYAIQLLQKNIEIQKEEEEFSKNMAIIRELIRKDPDEAERLLEKAEKHALKMNVIGAECAEQLPPIVNAIGQYPILLHNCQLLLEACESDLNGEKEAARKRFETAKKEWAEQTIPESWLHRFHIK